jgi:glutathione S-transferase
LSYRVAERQLAHARWAVGDAITAVDLCAAALGRLFAKYPQGTREMDLRSAERQLLTHAVAGPWISEVVTDPDYEAVHAFRTASVHRVMSRHATVSMGRCEVLHEFWPTLDGRRVQVDALPAIAREFATRHVEAFLRRALGGALSPATP